MLQGSRNTQPRSARSVVICAVTLKLSPRGTSQELVATGATAHSGRSATLGELTPQEARIAGLADEGLSNPEIAARLYISTNTVEYHLNKVFRKLGIRSRTQLHRALASAPASN